LTPILKPFIRNGRTGSAAWGGYCQNLLAKLRIQVTGPISGRLWLEIDLQTY